MSLIFSNAQPYAEADLKRRGELSFLTFNKALAVSTGFQHVVPRGSTTKASRSALQIPWNEKRWRLGPTCVSHLLSDSAPC